MSETFYINQVYCLPWDRITYSNTYSNEVSSVDPLGASLHLTLVGMEKFIKSNSERSENIEYNPRLNPKIDTIPLTEVDFKAITKLVQLDGSAWRWVVE